MPKRKSGKKIQKLFVAFTSLGFLTLCDAPMDTPSPVPTQKQIAVENPSKKPKKKTDEVTRKENAKAAKKPKKTTYEEVCKENENSFIMAGHMGSSHLTAGGFARTIDCYEDGKGLTYYIHASANIERETVSGSTVSKYVIRKKRVLSEHFGVETLKESDIDQIIEKTANKKIALFGEDHLDYRDGEVFASLMPQLKRIGFTRLGLEFPGKANKVVKRYMHGKISETDFFKAFPLSSRKVLVHEWANIFRAAKRLKFQTFGIDSDTIDITSREVEITRNIEDAMGGGRIVVFIGATHLITSQKFAMFSPLAGLSSKPPTFFGRQTGGLLKEKYGNKVVSINLAGCYTTYVDACLEPETILPSKQEP